VRASAIAFHVSGFSDDADAEELRKFHGRILQLEATAYPTRIDGITFYNVRRRAKVGYDYTAPNEQPHYILAELEVTPRDTLEVRLVRLVDGVPAKSNSTENGEVTRRLQLRNRRSTDRTPR